MMNRKKAAQILAAILCAGCALGGQSVISAANSGGEVQGTYYVGTAPDYHVVIDEGWSGSVYGQKADIGAASGGTVTIENGTVTGNVFGVYGTSGASNGWIEMSGGTTTVSMYGGQNIGSAGDVTANTIVISGTANVKESIAGGENWVSGNVVENKVIIRGGTIGDANNDTIWGGRALNGNAISNSVEISGGTVLGWIYGGETTATDGIAEKNQIIIRGDNVQIRNNGFDTSLAGGISSGAARGNQVVIEGASVIGENNSGIYIYGGNAQTLSEYNSVTISGGSVENGDIYGGYAREGAAENNRIIVSGGTITGYLTGGNTDSGTVANNSIEIKDGEIDGYLYGGGSNSGTVTDNSITLSGGTVRGGVYAGYTGAQDISAANHNTITVTGTANLSEANLYGNDKAATGTNENRFVVDGWRGTVQSLANFDAVDFQNLTFTPGSTVVDVTGTADLTNTDVNVSFAGGQHFAVGDTMNLISNVTNGPAEETVYIPAGVGQVVGAVLAQDDAAALTVNSIRLNAQIVLVGKSRAVSAAFVNQGSDLVSDGLDALGRDGQYGLKTFAAVYGGKHTYDVGSDLKINGWSTIAGLGGEHRVHGGDFLWGVLYENGTGNYRAWNEANGERFRGDGDLLYNGGGAAVRWERDSGFYVEGSVRAGTLKSDLSGALRDSAGRSYGYSSRSHYFGVHIGAGRRMNLGGDRELDLYGKYFHTYTEGDRFTVDGDRFTFDGVKSDRLRLGARVTHNAHGAVSAYYGLAWEYEFSGDAAMTVQGQRAPVESFGGGSVMAEAGLRWTPGGHSPWSFDVGLRGYAGEREGLSGTVQASYTF